MVLSQPRFQTYLNAANNDPERALDLYKWNSDVAAAFSFPLHLAEVAMRNGVAQSIENAFGQAWPTNGAFHISLGKRGAGYSPVSDLKRTTKNVGTTGIVIAELSFVFWQDMFTSRHDNAIWNKYLATNFPNCPHANVQQMRGHAYNEIEKVRSFRNRIAHHEPIFARNLNDDLDRVKEILKWRSQDALDWLDQHETVTALLGNRP